MTYEVQFQSGGTDYTVRAETIEDTLSLIQRVQAITKLADGGWVEWHGGNRPVAAHRMVEVVFRSGGKHMGAAHEVAWRHSTMPTDIVRYRVCA